MNSCLYECQVRHARLSPRRHRFAYRIFLLGIDLDELPELPRRLRWFSLNRWNLHSVREADYLPIDEPVHNGAPAAPRATTPESLATRVRRYLKARGVELPGGRITLVTMPRLFGYAFNPVSFYFCRDAQGELRAAIAEVTNTFHEIKPFFLGPEASRGQRGGLQSRQPKHFYVSPFSDVDVAFEFILRDPGERLSVQIDDFVGDERTLISTLQGERQQLTDGRLAWYTLKYPLVTLRVIALIHWHALRLWLKRVPWFAKAARPADQRGLYRPHPSVLRPNPS
jgi:DUF1365 family protein